MTNVYQQVSDERREIIIQRSTQFSKGLDIVDQEPVNVFDPLSPKLVSELELIRDVSTYLQKKKDEDINKAAKAEQQTIDEAKKTAEEAPKETEKKEA